MGRLIRNVFRLSMFLAVVGGGALAWTYYRSDELLKAEVLRQLGQVFPNAVISLERTNFDLQGRIRLFDLVIRTADDERPLLSIAETTIAIDQQQFTEHQRLAITQVRLSQPKLRVVRAPDGRWNWSQLQFVPPPISGSTPDIELVHGNLEVVLPDFATRTMISTPIREIQLSAKPASRKSYEFHASLRNDITGTLQIDGEAPLSSGPWSATLHASRLRANPQHLRTLLLAVPELQPPLTTLQQKLAALVPAGLTGHHVTPVSENGSAPALDLGLAFVAAADVKLAQTSWDEPLEWAARLQISEGQVTHASLPHPLFDLQGRVEVRPQEVRIQNLSARNGMSHLSVQGTAHLQEGLNVLVQVETVPLEEPLIVRLPEALQRHVRALELTGLVTGQLQLQLIPGGKPQIDAEATLEKGTVRHERFPYLVREVTGTLTWHQDTVQIQGAGIGGVTPVTVNGTIHHPGPESDAVFDIRTEDAACDDALLKAMPPSVAKLLRDLNFHGRGTTWVRLLRPAGLNQKYQVSLSSQIHHASLQYVGFPYPITDLRGLVHWAGDVVTIENVKGEHDGALITGSGRCDLAPAPGRLQLNISASNAAFDRALYAALPEHLQEVWQAFSPNGQFDTTANVDWVIGQPLLVDVPRFTVLNADFQMRELPYPFRQLKGEFAYSARDQRVEIRDFAARHDDTRLSGSGYAQIHANNTVTLALDKFHVDDLTPTPAFRSTLPPVLQNVVETLNPTGTYSIHGPVKFYGDRARGGIVGAEWDLQVLLAGCSLNAGLRIDNVHGRVRLGGRWTPQTTDLDGELDLDALDVMVNHQLTKVRGPFRMHDGVLSFGSAAIARAARGDEIGRVPAAERITAEAFDGRATLDAEIQLLDEPQYVAALELNGASLEKYSHRHLRGYNGVRGLMNGWMDIRGTGVHARGLSGEGQLQISPAALYELPVFLQIFQLPQFAPINRTAFDYANFFFRIDNERFNFQSIDLVGNTISLRGRGVVRFDGGVMLDFYSMQPRNQVRLPGLREIVGVVNMVSQGWVAVEVRGPIAAPIARVVPFPAVDSALQQFLGAFNPRMLTPPPVIHRGPPQTTFAPDSPRQ